LPEVAQDIVNVFAVGIQSAIQLIGHIVRGLQDAAQFDDGLAQIGTILRDGAFKGVDGFLRVSVGLF